MGAAGTGMRKGRGEKERIIYLHVQFKVLFLRQLFWQLTFSSICSINTPTAVPWKSSDLAPLLYAEPSRTIAPPQRGKSFIRDAGRACNKLPAQTAHQGHGAYRECGSQTHFQQFIHWSPYLKASANQGKLWGMRDKCFLKWRILGSRKEKIDQINFLQRQSNYATWKPYSKTL